MATFNYAGSAQTALKLIKKFGQKVPIARLTNTVNAVTQEETSSSSAGGDLDAVTVPATSSPVTMEFDDRTKEAITQGKVRFFIAAAVSAPFQPLPADIVTFEGLKWSVLGCTPLSPGGVPLVYFFGVIKTSVLTSTPEEAELFTFGGEELLTFAGDALTVFE